MILLQRPMHWLQMYTPGPATSRLTSPALPAEGAAARTIGAPCGITPSSHAMSLPEPDTPPSEAPMASWERSLLEAEPHGGGDFGWERRAGGAGDEERGQVEQIGEDPALICRAREVGEPSRATGPDTSADHP